MLGGTCMAMISWFVILVSVNPFTAGMFGFIAFYFTLFLGVLGITAMLGTFLRTRAIEAHDEAGILHAMVRSLRQGTLLSIALCGGLFALAHAWFSPLFFVLGLLVLGGLEFVLLLWEEHHVTRVLHKR